VREVQLMPELAMHLHADGVAVVHAPAMLDADTAPALRKALAALADTPTAPRVVVDCTAVEFTDSTGLAVLVGALKRVRARDGALVLAAVGERLGKTLRITGLAKAITVHESVEAALAALRRGGAEEAATEVPERR
jgi:anti-sigma B factor antagonist